MPPRVLPILGIFAGKTPAAHSSTQILPLVPRNQAATLFSGPIAAGQRGQRTSIGEDPGSILHFVPELSCRLEGYKMRVFLCVLGMTAIGMACHTQRSPAYGRECSPGTATDAKADLCGPYICVDGRCRECTSDSQCSHNIPDSPARCIDGQCGRPLPE